MNTGESDKHLTCKEFEAWVEVGDQPLLQFGVECQESTGESSTWIPSASGQRFSVCWRHLRKTRSTYVAKIRLDGHGISSHSFEESRGTVKKLSCIAVSPTETRDFVFNTAHLTDDDKYMDNPSSANVGEIKVVLQFSKVIRSFPPAPRVKTLPESTKIHERAKKGLVHQIEFSESTAQPYTIRGKSISDKIGDPVTFIFKYRSLDVLQANGIAPRPSPPPQFREDGPGSQAPPTNPEDTTLKCSTSNVKQEDELDELDELEDDDDDEITVKERELMAALEDVRSQKRARKHDGRPAKRVKTEYVNPFIPGEIIDLTEASENVPAHKSMKREFTNNCIPGEIVDLT